MSPIVIAAMLFFWNLVSASDFERSLEKLVEEATERAGRSYRLREDFYIKTETSASIDGKRYIYDFAPLRHIKLTPVKEWVDDIAEEYEKLLQKRAGNESKGLILVNGKQFLYVKSKKTWHEAKDECRRMGWDMAWSMNKADFDGLGHVLTDSSGQGNLYFVGTNAMILEGNRIQYRWWRSHRLIASDMWVEGSPPWTTHNDPRIVYLRVSELKGKTGLESYPTPPGVDPADMKALGFICQKIDKR